MARVIGYVSTRAAQTYIDGTIYCNTIYCNMGNYVSCNFPILIACVDYIVTIFYISFGLMADKITNKQLFEYWFTAIPDTPHTWKCKSEACTRPVKCDISNGYSNIVKHLNSKHNNPIGHFAQVVHNAIIASPEHLEHYFNTTQDGKNVYSWLHWIIRDNLPFTFCESAQTRKNSILKPISRNTLSKYLFEITKEVELKVKELLPERFGIVMDGWTEGTTHYFGVFAVFSDKDNGQVMILLGIQSPEDTTEKYC